jgi:hypothetical protein
MRAMKSVWAAALTVLVAGIVAAVLVPTTVNAQGWYFIVPPIIPTSEFNAPPDQWTAQQRFSVEQDCENYRLFVKTHADEVVQKTIQERPDFAIAKDSLKQRWLAAECRDDGNTWALIVPPSTIVVGIHAPHSQWLNMGAFSTAVSCEVYRLQVLKLVQDTATTEQSTRTRAMMSECISVGDPRLTPR